jgi:competence protein ComEA
MWRSIKYQFSKRREVMQKMRTIIVLLIVVAFAATLAVPAWSASPEKININTATVEELIRLDRVGPKYAAKIVEYREAYGPFKSPEEIMKVQGIGQKTYEVNMDAITVE